MKPGVWIPVLLCSGSLASGLWAQDIEHTSRDRTATTPETGPNEFGSVQGVVTFRGEIPRSQIADDAGLRRELLEVDRDTHGLRYVVAFLTPLNATSNQAAAVSQGSPAKPRITVDQQDYAFLPRVVAVRQSEPVTFTNSDPANHNVRTSSAAAPNEFNVFTGASGKYEHRFVADPQHRPIQLGCDIHPWMRGWIYVFDHPHFAVTDKRGAFRIGSVPPGEYKLMLRQPDIRYTHEQKITVSTKQATKAQIEVRAESLPKPKE